MSVYFVVWNVLFMYMCVQTDSPDSAQPRYPGISCVAGKWSDSPIRERENTHLIHVLDPYLEVNVDQHKGTDFEFSVLSLKWTGKPIAIGLPLLLTSAIQGLGKSTWSTGKCVYFLFLHGFGHLSHLNSSVHCIIQCFLPPSLPPSPLLFCFSCNALPHASSKENK